MATPVQYRSTDASAPVLTGEANKLNDLLYACLVTGYGAKAAAGWTRAYTSGNYSAFRPGSGLQHYLAVNDTAAQLSRAIGYVTMSDHVTGTQPFPTDAQVTGGLYMRKSITANTTARPWIMLATDKVFYLIVLGGGTVLTTVGGGDSHLAFGDLTAYLGGDAYNSFIVGGTDTSTTSVTAATTRQVLSNIGGGLAGHYMPRSYTQAGTAINIGKRAPTIYTQSLMGGSGGPVYPEPCSGGLFMAQLAGTETLLARRGIFPGLWNLAQVYTSFGHLDTFSGAGDLSGRNFLIVHTGGNAGMAFETTGGW